MKQTVALDYSTYDDRGRFKTGSWNNFGELRPTPENKREYESRNMNKTVYIKNGF